MSEVFIRPIAASALVVVLFASAAVATADLNQQFVGYDTVWEIGVTGRKSSYHLDTKSGVTRPNYVQELVSEPIVYPFGIGTAPSPGGYNPAVARSFDEGVLGIKFVGDDLVVRVAGGLDPTAGFFYGATGRWYGQGDVFLTVDSGGEIGHFALLNAWPHGTSGPITLDDGAFDLARDFHLQGGAGGTSLEGHLVSLTEDANVALVGGAGSFHPGFSPAPEGLDYRIFAQGGQDMGEAGLVHDTVTDTGFGGVEQTWYVQTWTLPISSLSATPAFTLGLHKAASCGNDQIGMVTVVPAPTAIILGQVGLATLWWFTRKRISTQCP